LLQEVRAISRCVYIDGAIDYINIRSVNVQYKPGCDNCVADCLSRSYDEVEHQTKLSNFDVDAQQLVGTIFGSWDTAIVTPTAVAAATEDDQQLSRLRNFVVDGWPSAKRAVPTDLHVFGSVTLEL
jgi:hypothetical protein